MGFAPVSKFGSYGNTFWDSKVGEIIGPIKIENFCGIFRVLGKTESQPIDFDLIKEEVTKAAQFEMQTGIIKDYIELLHNKVNIKIDEIVWKPYSICSTPALKNKIERDTSSFRALRTAQRPLSK